MSETDDTDVLLLIPPNFFLVKSSGSEDSLLESSRTVVHKPPSCTAQVLGKLVNQVYTLENRLDSLEISSVSESASSRGTRSRHHTLDLSESYNSSNRKFSTFPRRRSRKTSNRCKNIDLSLTSLDSTSTYDKRIPPLRLRRTLEPIKPSTSLIDDTLTMDSDISSIVSTPNKKNDKILLHEIDEFLTKVDNYEGPETKYKPLEPDLSPENLIKATGDYIHHKFDSKHSDEVKLPSGRVVPSDVLDKYIYLVKNNAAANTQADKTSTSLKVQHSTDTTHKVDVTPKSTQDETKSALETKSPSVRKLSFLEANKEIQTTSTPIRPQATNSSYLDSFRPSSNKIYDRATKVLEQYKAQNYVRNTHNASTNSNYVSPKKEEVFKLPRAYNLEMRDGPRISSLQTKFMDTIDTDLLSLSELWGEKREGADRVDSVKLEEEKMKREHCEALIQDLQKKLLDQQERLAVAVKVDRSKDIAISKLKDAWSRLTSGLERTEDRHRAALDKMDREVQNCRAAADEANKKSSHFEGELYKALDFAHDYQEKCKLLTQEKQDLQHNTERALAAKDEAIDAKTKEIQLLKENYETVMRLNKQSADCVKNVDEALEKERQEHEATKSKLNDLSRKVQTVIAESGAVKQERDVLRDKVNEERSRATLLERQLAEKQNLASDLLRKCDHLDEETKSLHKLLEFQKNELKSHYQKQLEAAVLAKLQEFQVQLEQAERDMEAESRRKEDAIVDTFNKQMSRIEEQHKLEINIVEEKHKEEIKLYRLQIAQLGEKMGLYESKLDSYRRRRTQIASELHNVMESQWRQALRILTDGRAHSVTRNDTVSTPEAQDYVAPKIPPLTMPQLPPSARSSLCRGLDFEGLSDSELQQYVKLLLAKPANFSHEGGGDAPQHDTGDKQRAEEPTSDRPERQDKRDKRRLSVSKPPWKA